MKNFKLNIIHFFLGLCLSFLSTLSFARPPVDLILNDVETLTGTPKIFEKDITYTDEQPLTEEEKLAEKYILRAQYKIIGRSKPNRKGKKLVLINEGQALQPFRYSKNKKWVAVIDSKKNIKSWIPLNALKDVQESNFSKNIEETPENERMPASIKD